MDFDQFVDYCKDRHDIEVDQKYDGNIPYSKHLEYVVAHCKRFNYLIRGWEESSPFRVEYVAELGCWGHDLIEDTRTTYNDIKDMIGKTVADIIYCCTEEKGRSRHERHSEKYYLELSENKLAIYVKLCDIMANVTYSILTKSSMYDKHKLEHEKTKKYLYREDLKPMFDYLDKLFELW